MIRKTVTDTYTNRVYHDNSNEETHKPLPRFGEPLHLKAKQQSLELGYEHHQQQQQDRRPSFLSRSANALAVNSPQYSFFNKMK
jgi:hypothetical protein